MEVLVQQEAMDLQELQGLEDLVVQQVRLVLMVRVE
jgi:hypothetical protein